MGIEDRLVDGAYDIVVSAYKGATGLRWFKGKRGPATDQNCREFVRLQFLLKLPVSALMEEALGFYGVEWCQETFKSKFPPFNVVIGEKARRRLVRGHRPSVPQTVASIEIQAKDMAKNLVGCLGKDGALSLVQEGWPQDERLRSAIFFILKEGE